MTRRQPLSLDGIVGPMELAVPELEVADLVPGVSLFQGERHLTLRVLLAPEAATNTREFVLDLGGWESEVSPYAIASELMAAADALITQEAAERGREAQARRLVERQHRRAERHRRETAPKLMEATRCDFCARPLAFAVDGVSYCKRHAEEHGVRPKGKIT